MKVKDIPTEIQESSALGEIFAWNFIEFIVDEIPESNEKIQILDLMATRRDNLLAGAL